MIVCGGKRMASQLSWYHLIVMKNAQYKTNIKEKCKFKQKKKFVLIWII